MSTDLYVSGTELPKALRHRFAGENRCSDCGVAWDAHRNSPAPCQTPAVKTIRKHKNDEAKRKKRESSRRGMTCRWCQTPYVAAKVNQLFCCTRCQKQHYKVHGRATV